MTRTARFATTIAALALSTTVAGTIAYARASRTGVPATAVLRALQPVHSRGRRREGPSRGDQIVSSDQNLRPVRQKGRSRHAGLRITKLSRSRPNARSRSSSPRARSPRSTWAAAAAQDRRGDRGTGRYNRRTGADDAVESGTDNSPHNVLTFRLLK